MTGRELIPWVVLGAGVVSVAVALVYFYSPSLTSPPAAEQVPATQPLAPQAEAPAEPPSKPQAEATGALEPPSKPMTVPTFDVVSGEGVLAGRAEPGWNVSVESGGTKVAEATADEQGEWSIVLEKPLPAGDHALSLKTTSPDGTRALSSQQTVSVAVAKAETKEVAGLPEAEKPPPPAASEEAPKEPPEAVTAAQSSPSQGQTAEDVPAAPTAPAEAPKPEAAAPAPATHVAEAETGGKPAGAQSAGAGEPSPSPQAPAETSAAPSPAKATIVIRTVDYQDAGADTGKMKLAGTSDPGAAIQLYFDDKPFANAIADRAGRWSAETDMKLGAGQHTFRAERYDEATHMMAGQAVVTIERRAPQVAAKAPPPEAAVPSAASPRPAPSEAKPGETAPGPAASPQVAAVETGTAEAAPERIVHHKRRGPASTPSAPAIRCGTSPSAISAAAGAIPRFITAIAM
jgi:hypothetical protein